MLIYKRSDTNEEYILSSENFKCEFSPIDESLGVKDRFSYSFVFELEGVISRYVFHIALEQSEAEESYKKIMEFISDKEKYIVSFVESDLFFRLTVTKISDDKEVQIKKRKTGKSILFYKDTETNRFIELDEPCFRFAIVT